MRVQEEGFRGWPPAPSIAPPYVQRDDNWSDFSNSLNAISFGFVATAILVSMFLLMALLEKFLRTNSPAVAPPGGSGGYSDIESQNHLIIECTGKLGRSSPIVSVNAREVSVLMPGDNVPTFIAQPAPVPCTPIGIPLPSPVT